MKTAPGDETATLLRALFALPADHAIEWEVRRDGEAAACMVVRAVGPGGDEVFVEVRVSAPGGRSWISEGGLELAYQGPGIGAGHGPRERLLAAMGASFRATMRQRGPEVRAQITRCLAPTGGGQSSGDTPAGRRTAVSPSVARDPAERPPIPAVLVMALERFDAYDGSATSDDGVAAVEPFVGGIVDAQTTAAAFELGLIDALLEDDLLSFDELRQRLGMTARGLGLITGLLVGSGVLDLRDERFTLSAAFRRALEHKGLLLTILGLTALAAQDLIENAPTFFRDPWEFCPRAHRVGLFNYDDADPEHARIWVAALSHLTRYEAPGCIRRYDFGRHRRVLDVGGNSGEFARQICVRHPHVEATVFDLPAVCTVGAKYVAGKPGGERVSFVGGSMATDPLPADFDLVCFKSVLNDWPAADVRDFLSKAFAALRPGGRILIYEREAVDLRRGRFPFQQLVVLPYMSNLRSAEEYSALLGDTGFVDIETERIELEMRFLIMTARRGAE